ncbi:PilX N-terminal domain-containing pilus assembly protein [Halomonas sp. M1]|uniref:pilus assembly PilX family protein n=1 Tax=Halomonas sp. M1 TaxID=3035470 RepID=UPI0024859740|nr:MULTISPECIES: PilX N-terminal domain-containing pilus assembly protein [unclassified Halomonas]MDP3535827.1 PilX N-terminal domain-containing pilus assembly protein [Halomonas sp.]WFE69976.1 PilX N-terminal domain-containing pilus assembly protein [Halomonas sp. M1]
MHEGVASQRGMALVLSLIFLAIVTILSVSSMQGALTQDRMASSQRDHTVAFQAAEAALRDAENQLQNGTTPATGWVTYTMNVEQLSRNPRYQVQALGFTGSYSNNERGEVREELYRIEAQGFGSSEDTSVTLETLYVRQQQAEVITP